MARKTDTWFSRQTVAFRLTLFFACVTYVATASLNEEENSLSSNNHIQKRALLSEEVDLVEVCTSIQRFEQLESAINVDLQTVQIHPEAWVFTTRCRVPGKPCKGFDENIRSLCRPKKSWVQLYARAMGESWRPHWVAVDTACVCSIRKNKRLFPPDILPMSESYLDE